MRKKWISGLLLHKVGLGGHFKSSKLTRAFDAYWLDDRQYRRFCRAKLKELKNVAV